MRQFWTSDSGRSCDLFRRDQHGGIAIAAAAGAFMMAGVAALTIDLGAVYAEQNHLQTVADLAALGAAQDLPNTAEARARASRLIEAGLQCDERRRPVPADQASAIAQQTVANHRPDQKGSDCGAYSASIGAGAITLGNWNEATGRVEPSDDNPSVIEVVLQRNERLGNAVPTTFARVFGVNMLDVSARAVAERGNGRRLELAWHSTSANPWTASGLPGCVRSVSIWSINSSVEMTTKTISGLLSYPLRGG